MSFAEIFASTYKAHRIKAQSVLSNFGIIALEKAISETDNTIKKMAYSAVRQGFYETCNQN